MHEPIYTTDSLKDLRPILEKWVELNMKYADEVAGDAIFWNNEETISGLLATASWMSGGLALQEYSDKRHNGDGDSSGRIDLWLRTPSGTEWVIEAKRRWIGLGRWQDDEDVITDRQRVWSSRITTTLDAAVAQAKTVDEVQVLGIV